MKLCNREGWSRFWESVVLSQNDFFGKGFLKFFLSLAAFCYAGITRLRNQAYDRGIFPVFRSKAKVICIGNLALGGTGKTELVIWCARRMIQDGKKTVILSRGYGRCSSRQEIVYFKNGQNPDAHIAGDEPVLAALRLKDVPVIVGADRVKSAELACKEFSAERLLLDDGFQHRRLYRDLDIVCLDERLFKAPALFPRGALRESVEALGRAHFAVIKTGSEPDKTGSEPEDFLIRFEKTFQRPLSLPRAFFRYRISHIRKDPSAEILPCEWLAGKNFFVFSGIGDPENFEELICEAQGKIQRVQRFCDHHCYEEDELLHMQRASAEMGSLLLTTEKDAVKLPWSVKYPSDFFVFVLCIKIEWLDGEKNLESMITGM